MARVEIILFQRVHIRDSSLRMGDDGKLADPSKPYTYIIKREPLSPYDNSMRARVAVLGNPIKLGQ